MEELQNNNGDELPKQGLKHDKNKPWDDPSIDHWKVDKFDPSWNESGMLEVSYFATIFPQYREKYLQDVWPQVKTALLEHGISCQLNLVEGTMTVTTTRKTRDPYIIVKARDLIKLLSRSVPAPQAIKILDDEMQCDIIKIGNLVRNKSRFVKRRQHLLGPNNSTLKALEILTGCYILVQGNTVAAMGSFKGLKLVRRIVEDCIRNKMHPIYHIKILMMKRELSKDPTLANENWDRFLPKFKKKNVQKKKAKGKEKKLYTPFPPPQQPSEIDEQLVTGEYFLSEQRKSAKKWLEKQEKQAEKAAESKRKRDSAYIPPKEPGMNENNNSTNEKGDVNAIAQSLKKKITLWESPPPSTLKWNIDASRKYHSSLCAIGGVLRDHSGNFKCIFSAPIPDMDINCAEVFAIHHAIKLSMANEDLREKAILFESDSLTAVKWCRESSGGPSNLNLILNYIRNHLNSRFTLVYKGRKTNGVADSLAKQGTHRYADFIAWM